MSHYILITGYRQQLAKAICELGIPYAVVTEKPLKNTPTGVDEVIVAPFSEISKAQDEAGLKAMGVSLKQTPTHVIAGTEAGVFPAAVLRRIYLARRSTKSLLIRCTDKMAMKKYLRSHQIPMAGFVTHSKELTADELVIELGLPVVVKDRKNSGGRNVVIAKTVDELQTLLAPQRLYEQFVDAAEGSIESFVVGGEIIFSNLTEYHTNKVSNIVPAGYTSTEKARIEALNVQVIKALNIKWGLTHLEYYRNKGQLQAKGDLFGEVALRPPGGYIMELIKRAYDFDPWAVFVKVELGLPVAELPAVAKRVCGTVLLHPGAGIVSKVSLPTTEDFPTLAKVTIKVKQGDHIEPRQGVGEDVGYCIFSAEKYTEVRQDIDKMCQATPVQIDH
ncbi:ATP-grasp domain-containing protein [Marinicella litoralis]|uniref:RimK-like ATP-grasp domain-containing protein n=1 Tax=Marinicella litoralis TaxID=644220 RepID=A0A4R6XR46_9GAMM|nr:ATP-grasp domain-containing protein [Marinicella litoralis]TDR20710.1 RimK-like ATP-grasp domain-containing protein [Marinicella litoralis]